MHSPEHGGASPVCQPHVQRRMERCPPAALVCVFQSGFPSGSVACWELTCPKSKVLGADLRNSL